MEDLAGRQLGTYQIVERAGEGSADIVYRAYQPSLDRFVAVKVIRPELAANPAVVDGLRRAAMAAARLSHPNILRVHDMQYAPGGATKQDSPGAAGQVPPSPGPPGEEGLHYIVADFAEGGSLAQRLARGALSPREAAALASEVAEALDYAHRRGLVHGNLTPSNILLDATGHALVADFGLTRALIAARPDVQGNAPEYMAPEQAQSLPVDARTDIYALGLILYQALTGYVPFRGETALSTLYKQVNQPPPSLAYAGLDAPELQSVVEKALAKNPDGRFQSGSAFAAALRQVELQPASPSEAPTIAPGARRAPTEPASPPSAVSAPPPPPVATPPPPPPTATQSRPPEPFRGLPTSSGPVRVPIGVPEPERGTSWGLLAGAAAIGLLLVVAFTVVVIGAIRRSHAARAAAPTAGVLADSATPTRTPIRPTPTHTAIIVVIDTPTVEPTGTAVPSDTPTPTATGKPFGGDVSPSDTPSATTTPSSTPTSTATATPAATSTPAATATITNTPAPTATPTGTPTPTPPVLAVGGHIAYPLHNPQNGLTDVWVARADGSDQHPLIACMRQPDFRADGRLVMNGEGCSTDSIWAVNLDGSEKRELTSHPEDSHPTWSPDGGSIVYSSTQQGDGQPRLYVQSIQDKPQAPPFIVFGGTGLIGILPTWLPGGEIAYNGCDYGFGGGGNCGVWIVSPDGSQLRRLTTDSSDRAVDAHGANLVFMTARDGNWEAYRVRADGSGLTRLTSNEANDGLPTWSPDGSVIAFASDRDGQWAIWAMRPDGSGQQKLFNLNGTLGPRWIEERISWGP